MCGHSMLLTLFCGKIRSPGRANAFRSGPYGRNRADMFEKLREAKAFSLAGPEAAAAIKKAIHWTMK